MNGYAKTVFVTGGSRGIGNGIVRRFAEEGYDVAFTYSKGENEAKATAEHIREMGRRCFYYHANFEDPNVPTEVTKRAISDLGRIDVLVNNAGMYFGRSIVDITAEMIDKVYSVNFRSHFLCTTVAAQHMIEHGVKGNIINISSVRGYRAFPGDSLYCSFKAGLILATETIALDLAPYDIRVNCVAPGSTKIRGPIDDEALHNAGIAHKIPLGRVGSPIDIAEAVLFLVSEKASYITGTTIKVDGGLILPGMPENMSLESGNGWGVPRNTSEKDKVE